MIRTFQDAVTEVRSTAGLSSITESRLLLHANRAIMDIVNRVPEVAQQGHAERLEYNLTADVDFIEFDRPFSQVISAWLYNSSTDKYIRLTAQTLTTLNKDETDFEMEGPATPEYFYTKNTAAGKTGIALHPRPAASIIGTTTDKYNKVIVLVSAPANSVTNGAADYILTDEIPHVLQPGDVLVSAMRYRAALNIRPQDAIAYNQLYLQEVQNLRARLATMILSLPQTQDANPRVSG